MEEMKSEAKVTKTKVFNVIILDRSGSMATIRSAAIGGLNETLVSIQKAQEKFSDTQEHFVSLVVFCSCETKLFFDKLPVRKAHPLKWNDYEPCCCTPLFDAMGFTLTAMRKYIKGMEDVAVMVTIITDGLENASKEYNGQAIKRLVEELRGEGWSFTYMGANQDAVEVAMNMSIRNSRNFEYNDAGTRESMRKDSCTRMNFFTKLADFKRAEYECSRAPMSVEKRRKCYTSMADEAFDEEESKS